MAEPYEDPLEPEKAKAPAKTPAVKDSAEVDAARDMIAAVKASDPTAFSLGFKRLYEACYGDEEDDESEV